MNTQVLVQVLGSAGVAAIIVAVINAIVGRKKLGAEATKIITDAAAGTVQDLREENVGLRDRVKGLEDREQVYLAERREWERERTEWRRVLQVHAAWDALAITSLHKAIPPISLPPAPPLTPPTVPRLDPANPTDD